MIPPPHFDQKPSMAVEMALANGIVCCPLSTMGLPIFRGVLAWESLKILWALGWGVGLVGVLLLPDHGAITPHTYSHVN